MNGIAKIGTVLMARILDFAFSGYGLVCDVVILKILFQHFHYQCIRCRNLWMESRMRYNVRGIRSQILTP
ncbi:MAG: hypothetical protein Q8918_06675 [Bacteroidota bacterium]|nr:hypothetical protein [Bacteroidota bacterium]MDP4213469.1 hypothetical protein [Bacteroidota bacterium]MDP4249777.1 hypothetical protein [Bacteroidota bacterium]